MIKGTRLYSILFVFAALVSLSIYSQDVYAADDPVIYDDGPPGEGLSFLADTRIYAEDFMLTESASLTDVHFWLSNGGAFDGRVEYFVFADNMGQPGIQIATGFGTNLTLTPQFPAINCRSPPCFLISMDLVNPVPLDAGVKYWFAWSVPTGFFINPISDPRNVGLLVDGSPVNSEALKSNDGISWAPLAGTGIPFSLTGSAGGPPPPSDSDGDGIDDDIDTQPATPSSSFFVSGT